MNIEHHIRVDMIKHVYLMNSNPLMRDFLNFKTYFCQLPLSKMISIWKNIFKILMTHTAVTISIITFLFAILSDTEKSHESFCLTLSILWGLVQPPGT